MQRNSARDDKLFFSSDFTQIFQFVLYYMEYGLDCLKNKCTDFLLILRSHFGFTRISMDFHLKFLISYEHRTLF